MLTRVRNMLEVRLLHMESNNHRTVLEQTVREVEASREVIERAAHHDDGEGVNTRINHLSEYPHRVQVVE